MTDQTRTYDATSLDSDAVNPAYALCDKSDAPEISVNTWDGQPDFDWKNATDPIATDAPEIPDAVLSAAARLHATDVYPVGAGTWQMERYGRAGTLKRELEALGFVVRSATDDRLDDQRYCYAMFREGVK